MMKKVQKVSKYFINRLIKEDPDLANNQVYDNNNINIIINIDYSLRIFKLVIYIFNCSYFFGVIFHIYS